MKIMRSNQKKTKKKGKKTKGIRKKEIKINLSFFLLFCFSIFNTCLTVFFFFSKQNNNQRKKKLKIPLFYMGWQRVVEGSLKFQIFLFSFFFDLG
ncbi:hypothetical protein ES319_A08G232000v1 [Gossypium barbadense]|uniref:Uncharacterized protein n=1 Tax=Gossypium barbadense TaxID=3634 RepID=A0A5J5UW39_GOSBA|nr:hypothetical protein ES319_A08G232000v1 [Gossypium barbadense]